ncbi:hypothetical protein AB0J01_27935, partial [Streptomyces sp. NPDC050204]|uniref:hypothetical protein n=1 Tax=Streptomyces sp. NPDC050204 TaxID=3155514 RepID=UPI00341AB2A0
SVGSPESVPPEESLASPAATLAEADTSAAGNTSGAFAVTFPANNWSVADAPGAANKPAAAIAAAVAETRRTRRDRVVRMDRIASPLGMKGRTELRRN